MITITRRNYPIAYVRPSVTKKRAGCSEFVCEMKCVREDFTSHTISLHYINDGTICLRILIKKTELMIPLILILKALIDNPDIYLYNKIVRGTKKNPKLNECVEVLIADGKKYGYNTQKEYLTHLGKILRNFIGFKDITDITNEEVGRGSLLNSSHIFITSLLFSPKSFITAHLVMVASSGYWV